MKKLLFYFVIAFAILSSSNMMAQQGFGTNTPDKSAAVDIVSTKRGFLMPRIALTSTTVNTPVANPHNALMVYNTATAGDVTPGFYYWSVTAFNPADEGTFHGAGKWVRVVDADDIRTTKVTGLDGSINVDETTDVDGNPSFDVSIAAGLADNQVMVTILNPAYVDAATTPDEPQFITKWEDYTEILEDLAVENGLEWVDDGSGNMSVQLGGDLTRDTNINSNGNDMVFTMTGAGELKLVGLEDIDIDTLDFTPGTGVNEGDSVAIVKADGTVQKISLEDLIAQTTYTADNGLTMTDNNVQLGGVLTQNTEIQTAANTLEFNVSDPGGAIEFKGLTAAAADNMIMVTDATTGKVHTVLRSISGEADEASLAIDTITEGGPTSVYSPFVQEVNVAVTLAAADVDVTLPTASASNKGQVVNIRITNTTDAHDGYCNIVATGQGTLTWGAMPYQGWVVKSDGANWVVVGRN